MRKLAQLAVFFGSSAMTACGLRSEPKPSAQNAYDFSFESLDGDPMPLSQYKGKALLVVNTASQCGFTPQYKGLEALYQQYKEKGLMIIAVPSNDFGGQEPGSAADIKKVCKNYGVTFPITAKYEITGGRAHPFYRWIAETLGFGSGPKWNFHKYLIDSKGNPVDYFGSMITPDSEKLSNAIEEILLDYNPL